MSKHLRKPRLLAIVGSGTEVPWVTPAVEWETSDLSDALEVLLRARLNGAPFSAVVVLGEGMETAQVEALRLQPTLCSTPFLRLEEQAWCLYAPDGAEPTLLELLTDLARKRHQRPSSGRWQVLVVDDVAVNRKLIGGYLERAQQQALFASDGDEALEILQETSPDLILMDVEMPQKDGLQTVVELRGSKLAARNCPVVAVTGHSGAAERERCLAAGMDDLLVKPVTRDALTGVLERWAGRAVFHARPQLPEPAENAAPIALEQLERDVGYDRNLFGSLVESFVEDVECSLQAIHRAVAEDDYPAVQRWAHSVYGAASYFGARRLERLAQSLELLGLDGGSKELLDGLLRSFLVEWSLVKEALTTALTCRGGCEVEIVEPLSLEPEQRILIDLHSFLNILNVISAELLRVEEAVNRLSDLQGCLKALDDFARRLREPSKTRQALVGLPTMLASFWTCFDELRPKETDQARETLLSARDNLESIFSVIEARSKDLLQRLEQPELWLEMSLEELLEGTRRMLAAVEKNAKGRYHIVYNIAAQESNDYLVHLDMKSVDGPFVTMPAVFVDVLRDLIANARKYTDPGGTIQAGLSDDGVCLKIAVEDSGRGIPEREISNVVKFGYRASNVSDRPTMGAGFGLTKAYWATKRFDGRMWIRSEVGRGTRVTIHLPSRSPRGPGVGDGVR